MPATSRHASSAGKRGVKIGDDAVLAKTGRAWPQWFELIDAAGGKRMDHKQIVAVVGAAGAGPWWRQMVTVTYEQARGLREKHQTPQGYQVGASKTIAAPAEDLFREWTDARRRAKWLPEGSDASIRKATPAKSIRITWGDSTHVDVQFWPKSDDRCQVTVEHRKLANATSARRMKKFWSAALQRLAERSDSSRRHFAGATAAAGAGT